jgi:hypothetical protein
MILMRLVTSFFCHMTRANAGFEWSKIPLSNPRWQCNKRYPLVLIVSALTTLKNSASRPLKLIRKERKR